MGRQLIYHYCTIPTAISMLKNQEIWMTSIRNLNDSNETIGVYKLFFAELEQFDTAGHFRDLLNLARQPGAIELYENPPTEYPEYVTCFCQNPDAVSQWIAYADNGFGLALGFDEEDFLQIDKSNGLDYRAIRYVSSEDMRQAVPSIYQYLLNNRCDNTPAMMDMAMDKIKERYAIGRDHKTFHYRSECEKRIIYNYPVRVTGLPQGWEIRDIGVYAKKSMINTYVPLGFPKEAVKAIVTGPKYQSSSYELEIALRALGYNTNAIQIVKSTSGYR